MKKILKNTSVKVQNQASQKETLTKIGARAFLSEKPEKTIGVKHLNEKQLIKRA